MFFKRKRHTLGRRRKSKGPTWLLTVSFLLISGWTFGFLWFLAYLPIEVNSNNLQSADGIVVLTGSPGRIQKGIDLLKATKGKRLLISGVNADLANETIIKAIGSGDTLAKCCIDLGREAANTTGNAIESANWARENGFTSLIIITSDYHLPRSLLELDKTMGTITLIPASVTNKAPLTTLALEYSKYLVSLGQTSISNLIQ